jgi:pilus assembly protein CpaF
MSTAQKAAKTLSSNGLGPLQPLLDDDTVTEVMVNGANAVFAERDGELVRTEIHFASDEQIIDMVNEIIRPFGRALSYDEPSIDARLPDGSRLNAIIPPIAIDGPSVTIRKFPKTFAGMDELIRLGSISRNMAAFLDACVKARMNLIVSGGVSSGKTTMLNVLAGSIPGRERLVTIEDSAELKLQYDHVVRLEARPAEVGKENEISIRSLVHNALRMRPDRIIVGEVRGPEAFDMLQAMNTGLPGSMATVHANSPRDAISRLENLVLLAGVELPLISIRQQIASAVDVIIQLGRLADGSRKVILITEVTGMEGDIVTMGDLFAFEQTGTTPEGKIIGELKGEGVPPMLMPRLKAAGFDPGFEIFARARQR